MQGSLANIRVTLRRRAWHEDSRFGVTVVAPKSFSSSGVRAAKPALSADTYALTCILRIQLMIVNYLDNSQYLTTSGVITSPLGHTSSVPASPAGYRPGFSPLLGFGAGGPAPPRHPDPPTELLVELIRTVGAVEEARQDAFMEGVMLAHEQVQDQLIKLSTKRPPDSAWWTVAEIAFTFFLRSPATGRWAAEASRRLVAHILRNRVVSAEIFEMTNGAFVAKRATRSLALVLENAKQLGLDKLDVPMHVQFLQKVASAEPASWSAAVNALAAGARREVSNIRSQSGLLVAEDTAGVANLAAAYELRSRCRLATRLWTMHLERFVRSVELTKEDRASLSKYLIDQLSPEQVKGRDGKTVTLDINSLRLRAARAYEATIWAQTYGFASKNPPGEPRWKAQKKTIDGIGENVMDYLYKRFGDLIEEQAWFQAPQGIGVSQVPGASGVHWKPGTRWDNLAEYQKARSMWKYLTQVSKDSSSKRPRQ
jgi:hypothetical protein